MDIGSTCTKRSPVTAMLPLFLVVCLCFMTMSGCGPWRDRYLDKGVDKLTQQQVEEKFGPPHTTKTPALGGDTIWTYRFPMSEKELHPYDPAVFTSGAKRSPVSSSPFGKSVAKGDDAYRETLYCYRYTLAFDESKVLKNWKREECVPHSDQDRLAP